MTVYRSSAKTARTMFESIRKLEIDSEKEKNNEAETWDTYNATTDWQVHEQNA